MSLTPHALPSRNNVSVYLIPGPFLWEKGADPFVQPGYFCWQVELILYSTSDASITMGGHHIPKLPNLYTYHM